MSDDLDPVRRGGDFAEPAALDSAIMLARDIEGLEEIVRIITTPEVKARLAAQGAEALPSTPEELGRYTRAEMQRWQVVIRQSGARAD